MVECSKQSHRFTLVPFPSCPYLLFPVLHVYSVRMTVKFPAISCNNIRCHFLCAALATYSCFPTHGQCRSHLFMSSPVVLKEPKYRLGHPEHYLLSSYKKNIFCIKVSENMFQLILKTEVLVVITTLRNSRGMEYYQYVASHILLDNL